MLAHPDFVKIGIAVFFLFLFFLFIMFLQQERDMTRGPRYRGRHRK